MLDLATLRAHLVGCFAPDFRIVGNATQREIVEAIDAAQVAIETLTAERDEARSLKVPASTEAVLLAQMAQCVAEVDRDQARRELEAVMAENEMLHRAGDFVAEMADEDCSYEDDCPSNARHYQCMRCKAKHALASKELPK